MQKSHLNALCRRFAKTAQRTVQDTTDVSTFQMLMAKRCQTLPLQVLLAYAHTHTLSSIKTTCCAASLSRRRSYSSRRGSTGNCYKALSRSLSKKVKKLAHRITEAQLFERSCCRVTLEKRAVSYTHLRAHETPEHLVCRLLLEKKKTI